MSKMRILHRLLGLSRDKTIGTRMGEIRSTHVRKCAHCGVAITDANDSGWEAFVTGTYTQRVCKDCDIRVWGVDAAPIKVE